MYKGIQSTKKEQTATVLLDLTRLSVWLHYYYNIYLIEIKEQQSKKKRKKKWKAPPHPPLPPAEAGRKRK